MIKGLSRSVLAALVSAFVIAIGVRIMALLWGDDAADKAVQWVLALWSTAWLHPLSSWPIPFVTGFGVAYTTMLANRLLARPKGGRTKQEELADKAGELSASIKIETHGLRPRGLSATTKAKYEIFRTEFESFSGLRFPEITPELEPKLATNLLDEIATYLSENKIDQLKQINASRIAAFNAIDCSQAH